MALRDINLVPESTLERRYAQRHAVIWGILYSVVVAVAIAAYVGCLRGVVLKGRTGASEEQIRKQIAVVIAEIQDKKEALERVAFVRDVSSPFGVSEVLGILASAMDPETWLTEVSLSEGDSGRHRLRMQGLATSNSRLGETIRTLGDDPHFEDILLRNSSELSRALPGGTSDGIVQFTIEATVSTE